MFAKRYDATKLKLNLKLAITRLQMLQKKKENLTVLERKKIAEDLGRGKDELARVRVEQVIRDDYLIESYELLEMYCSLLSTRFGLIDSVKDCDRGIEESVTTIIWSSARVQDEVPELGAIAEQLALRYGKEFARAAQENSGQVVNQRVVHKLSVSTPQPELVDGYLLTIAQKYGVQWVPPERPPEVPVGHLIDTAPCLDCHQPLIPEKGGYVSPPAHYQQPPPAFQAPPPAFQQQPPPFNQFVPPPSAAFPPAPAFNPSMYPPPQVQPGQQPPMPPADMSGDGPSFEELNRRFEMLKQQK